MAQKTGSKQTLPWNFRPAPRLGIWKPKSELKPREEEEEEQSPPPLFETDPCCSGDTGMQIFWYKPMGSARFGIHMNAVEFEKYCSLFPQEIQQEIQAQAFRAGISHEYFHHIVDSWCHRNEVERGPLKEKYESALRAEDRVDGLILIVEEGMASALSVEWNVSEGVLPRMKKSSYGLWQALVKDEEIDPIPDDEDLIPRRRLDSIKWLEASRIVALQYLEGSYSINGVTPKEGFTTPKILSGTTVPTEWVDKIPESKSLISEGPACDWGFQNKPDSGIWHVENIHFTVHGTEDQRETYRSMRSEMVKELTELYGSQE